MTLCILGIINTIVPNALLDAQDVDATKIQNISDELEISTIQSEDIIEDSIIIKEGIELTSNDLVVDEQFLSSMGIENETIEFLKTVDSNITEEDYETMKSLDQIGAIELEAASAKISGNTLILKLTGNDVRNIVNGSYAAAAIFAIIGTFTGGTGWVVAGIILGAVSSIASNSLSFQKGVTVKIPKPKIKRQITIYANGKSYVRGY